MSSPTFVWHFYDGRAGMEPRIRELREHADFPIMPTLGKSLLSSSYLA